MPKLTDICYIHRKNLLLSINVKVKFVDETDPSNHLNSCYKKWTVLLDNDQILH